MAHERHGADDFRQVRAYERQGADHVCKGRTHERERQGACFFGAAAT